MDNNALDKIPGMGAAEERAILDAIESDIATSTIDTTEYTEITGVEVGNTGVCVEITLLGIENQRV